MDRDDIDFDLRDIDEDILDLLEDGRQTRQNLAALLDVTGEYVYQRIDLLIKLGVVEKIHDGFYELSGGDDVNPETDESHVAIESASDERRTEHKTEPYPEAEIPPGLAEEIERYRGELEVSGTDHVDERVRAAKAIGRMLVAEDGLRKSVAQQKLLPATAVPGQNEETWWDKAGKRRFEKVKSIDWSQTKQEYVLTE